MDDGAEADRGEGDEAEVGGGDEVPLLPDVEESGAHGQVDHDGEDADDEGDRDLVSLHVGLLVEHLVPELPGLPEGLAGHPLRHQAGDPAPPGGSKGTSAHLDI